MSAREDPVLFPDLVPEEPVKMTAGQRLRGRQDAQVARGVHPLTGLAISPLAETCGTCAHRILVGGHARDWPKCDLMGTRNSHGQATDCLARFPACIGWEPR